MQKRLKLGEGRHLDYLINPSREELERMACKVAASRTAIRANDYVLRGLEDRRDGKHYWWDGWILTHYNFTFEMSLVEPGGNDYLYRYEFVCQEPPGLFPEGSTTGPNTEGQSLC